MTPRQVGNLCAWPGLRPFPSATPEAPSLNTTDPELAELSARIARLEAELVETRRVNDAWRALQVRSELILDRISRRCDEVLQARASDGLASAFGARRSGN